MMGLTSNKERMLRIFWQKLRSTSCLPEALGEATGGLFQ